MTALIPTEQPTTLLPIRRALVSVSDKAHLAVLAAAFREQGITVLSTGGTAKALRELGVTVTDVSEYTGFPEIMDGRVKTLNPRIHGGILGRKGVDEAVLAKHDIAYFDLVVVNLYPFEQATAKADCSYAEAVENIDIGGPSMLRAAAKNHAHIAVLTDPEDYQAFADELANDREISFASRQRWAAKAFAQSAHYEQAISAYFAEQLADADNHTDGFPALLPALTAGVVLRYGENPHQQASFYRETTPASGTLGAAKLLQGKALSYNNLADADAALEAVKVYDAPACVIVKHANPCGVATAETQLAAYERAYAADTTSAFGGILAFNQPLQAATARKILGNQYAEVILAPSIDADALPILAEKKNIRVMATGNWAGLADAAQLKRISGGLLVQSADVIRQTAADWKVVTQRQPTEQEWQDMIFAWQVVRFVKSNAIVFVKDQQTVGIGAGQMSRVISVKIAAMKAIDANLPMQGAVMASDAFFPFADGLEAALEHGLTAVIHPGGSMRDDEVIAAADKAGIAMVMTGTRHFRH